MSKLKHLNKSVGKIKITKALKQQIDYYHSKVGNKEWSGILFYRHVSGDFTVMKDLEFEAFSLYIMDIGSAAYTEFEYNKEIINAYKAIPEAIEYSSGLCHTHHTMSAYFSGTDLQELESNSGKYNYYVSLIVSFVDDYKCKIVFPSKTKVFYTSIIKDTYGENVEIKQEEEKEILLCGNLDVVLPEGHELDGWIKDRVKELEEKNKSKSTYSPEGDIGPAGSNTYGTYEKNPTYENNYYRSNRNALGYKSPSAYKQSWPSVSRDTASKVQSYGNKLENFLIALLTLDNSAKIESVEEAIKLNNAIPEEERDVYFSGLESNLEILHFNVFDSYTFVTEHIMAAVILLETHENYEEDVVEFLKMQYEYE